MTIKVLPFLCLWATSTLLAQSPFQQQTPLQRLNIEQQEQLRRQNEASMRAMNPPTKSQQEQERQIQEANRDMQAAPTVNYEFPEIKTPSAAHFKTAATELTDMLEGKQPMSLKRAVFLSENAFYDNKLNYNAFCQAIDMEIDVIQSFMQKEGYALDDDMAKKYCLQRLMSDTLVMKDAKGRVQFTHLPYRYDFDDPFGERDYQKAFVTKLLWDKTGQCHSLPLLYLILAEELHIKAWMAYGPQHSYIKLQDNKGAWYNYETTNGHYSSDSWLLSSGYINANALKTHIFMDTLSTQQNIAACLVDLTMAYSRKCGIDKFVQSTIDKALVHFPNSIQALQVKANYYTFLCKYVGKQLNYPPKSHMYLYPQAEVLLKQLYNQHVAIDRTGYKDIPLSVYQEWLKSFEIERLKQPVKEIRP